MLKAGGNGPHQLYNPVIFQIESWGAGRWRDLSRSWPASFRTVIQEDLLSISHSLSNFPGSFLFHLCFVSTPFPLLAPDLDQVVVLASVLLFGCTEWDFPTSSLGILWMVSIQRYLQRFCLLMPCGLPLHLLAFTCCGHALPHHNLSSYDFLPGSTLHLPKTTSSTPHDSSLRWVFYHLAVEEINTQRG